MIFQFYDADCLAIVPIFVNTGAALLPAVLGALASVLAVVLRPRELLGLCRRKPYIPVLVVLAGIGIYFLGAMLLAGTDKTSAGKKHTQTGQISAGSTGIDWAKVALEILRNQHLANEPDITAVVPASQDGPAAPRIYRGDTSRCGYTGGPSPVGLVGLWEFSEPDTMYPSSPVAVGDCVYGASCLLDPPETYGIIFCLDAQTGRQRWLTDLKDPDTEAEFKGFFSSPAVSADGKYLVIGQGMHFDDNCELVCLDARTGRVHWLFETPLHIEGSPAIEGDIVVAGAGAIETGDSQKPKGHPGFVFAVRLSDGKELWRYQINDPESSPAIDNGIVYIGSGVNGSAVVALRTESDEVLREKGLERLIWNIPTPHPATGAVTLTDDLVLIGCGNSNYVFVAPNSEGFVLALEKPTGKLKWKVPVPDAVLGAIAVRNDIAICPVRNGEIIALDLKNSGSVLWRQRVHNNEPVLAGAALTENFAYVVSRDGYMLILNIEDGSVIEKQYINARGRPGEMGLSISSPFVANGRVYVGSETGGLRCFVGKELK